MEGRFDPDRLVRNPFPPPLDHLKTTPLLPPTQLAPNGPHDGEIGHRIRAGALRPRRRQPHRTTPRQLPERDSAVLEDMGRNRGSETVRRSVDLCRRTAAGAGVRVVQSARILRSTNTSHGYAFCFFASASTIDYIDYCVSIIGHCFFFCKELGFFLERV